MKTSSATVATTAGRAPKHQTTKVSRTAWAAAATTAVLTASATLWAAPQHVRLSYTGPTDNSMTVSWNTPDDVGTEVQYGTSAGNLTCTETGTSFAATGALGYVHEVTLTNLSPNTVYYYQAGEAADGYSPEYSFTTGPLPDENCGQFNFVYIGDNRLDPFLPGSGADYDLILNQIVAHQPVFLLNGGDLVYEGTDIDQWIEYVGYNDDQVAYLPNMPALGNHDTGPGQGDSAVYNQLFALPYSSGAYGSNAEDYYYFTYGNLIVVALSTDSFEGGSFPFETQAQWLDEVLTNNPRKWKIVFYHKPTYTNEVVFSISHGPNEEGQNAAFVPIFDKHHVDVVLAAHNHWYERYGPSNCTAQGNPGSDDPCPVGDPSQGTIYIVSGGGGATAIPGAFCLDPAPPGRAHCAGGHHYLRFDIDNETLTMEAWGATPAPNTVFDTLTITKPASNCTPIPPDGGVGGGCGGPGGGGSGAGGTGTGGTGTGGTGTGGTGTGGTGNTGTGANAATPQDDGGCGCRARPSPTSALPAAGLLLGLGLALRRRRAPKRA